ncbi:hypothetical protein [Gallaecimonas pentaromativorans]|uniref:Uncharacterized protein n=1 Tax=Gallaecimonas pentaromativorans TaxID=584787 RepID=A0A3N1PG91_9GAMM|nr:hypothetical protein [Gallaecimonas pentaromativorans]MED5525347.1 hypothetical protein [Pseudomonadota bacterium]ROQ27605.1 hypothetical protein EDC28_104256 [Gallaecimonas pentaromativorans]
MVELLNFLNELGRDAAVAREFQHNPRALMVSRGLDSRCQDALLQGDMAQVGTLAAVPSVNMIISIVTSFGE